MPTVKDDPWLRLWKCFPKPHAEGIEEMLKEGEPNTRRYPVGKVTDPDMEEAVGIVTRLGEKFERDLRDAMSKLPPLEPGLSGEMCDKKG